MRHLIIVFFTMVLFACPKNKPRTISDYFDENAFDIYSDSSKLEGSAITEDEFNRLVNPEATPDTAIDDLYLYKFDIGTLCMKEWVIRNNNRSRMIHATIKFWIFNQSGFHIERVSLEPGDEKSLGLACYGCGSTCRDAAVTGARYSNE